MSNRYFYLAAFVIGFLSATLCGATATAAPPDLGSDAVRKKIESLVKPYIESQQVDGLSIGLVGGDKDLTLHFGKLTAKGQQPSDDTVYEIGSVSKVFTGVMLADAVVQGKVKLDQPAAELLPAGATMPQKGDNPITLKDLSIHRSGLPRLPNNMKSIGSGNPYSDYTSDLAMAFLKTHSLRREPGEEMEYSNFAVSFLGNLLCRQAGKSYDELLADRIAGPLAMSDTTVSANKDVVKRLVTGHSTKGNATSSWEFADMPGAGGIRSTTADMMRFVKANLDPPDNDLGKALNLAWEIQHPGNAKDFGMGLGWHLARDQSTRWHNGQTGGYHAMCMVNRDLSCGIVLMTNTATMEVDRLAGDLIRFLAGADVEPRKFDAELKVPVAKMKRCEGEYQLFPGFKFDVKVVSGRLMIQLTGQPSIQVYAKSETEWFYKVVKAEVTFSNLKDGKFQELELFQNGLRQKAKRIK